MHKTTIKRHITEKKDIVDKHVPPKSIKNTQAYVISLPTPSPPPSPNTDTMTQTLKSQRIHPNLKDICTARMKKKPLSVFDDRTNGD